MPTIATPKPPLSRAYTLKASKIPNYFNVLLDNPEPEVFDTAFLAKSGFRYAIDRAFIDILTNLGFLTEAGIPTRRYRDFLDHRQAATALRLGLAEAYAGLLAELPQAAACSEVQIMETVSRYFEGEINDMAAGGIAATFLALTRYAAGPDSGSAMAGAALRPAVATIPASEPVAAAAVASGPPAGAASNPVGATQSAPKPATASQSAAAPEPVAAVSAAFAVAPVVAPESVAEAGAASLTAAPAPKAGPEPAAQAAPAPETAVPVSPVAEPETSAKTDGAPGITIAAFSSESLGQAQDASQRPVIHITLPASTDAAVYDAIFASLKRHLLSPGDNA